nr:polyprenyl synthetase family protein [Allorhizocola rhizosphaerae]
MCYWGWRGAGGADCREIVAVAAALELFHAFALIQDDVMDCSDSRRGRPTLHRRFERLHTDRGWRGSSVRFGMSTAVLAGDLCTMWADEQLHGSGFDAETLSAGLPIYHLMRDEVIAGQYLDLLEQSRGPLSVSAALNVIRYKTARYTVQGPLQLGGALAGAGPQLLEAYSAFALPLGEAFQLQDDLLGVFGDPAVIGKSTVDDLREGKSTVLAAHTLARSSAPQRRRFLALFGRSGLDADGVTELRQMMEHSGARRVVEQMIAARTARALKVLESMPICPEASAALRELAIDLTARAR